MKTISRDLRDLSSCRRCPRLVTHLDCQRQRFPNYFNAPVPPRGRKSARLLIMGLAPGASGANRTGRVFVGDSSSDFLAAALLRTGFGEMPADASLDPLDSGALQLKGVRLSNVVKCLPPANSPTAAEVTACAGYLATEVADLWRPGVRTPRVLLALGGTAFRALFAALPAELVRPRPLPKFGHGVELALAPRLTLLASFHPSRLNTQTGRLTPPMFDQVLTRARDLLGTAQGTSA
ncbi:MAG: uracil-DNA glycosylase family protein [Pseudomonadota bacterium]